MTITKEGALASFYTVNKAPIKHLKVYFSPKQAGEGTPSPENVRPIEGTTNFALNITGANIYDPAKVRTRGHDDWDGIMGGQKQKYAATAWPRWTCVIDAIPGASYYWTTPCYEIGFLDKDENVLDSYMGWGTPPRIAPANAAYVYHTWIKNETLTEEETQAMHRTMDLYIGSVPPSFEPYHGQTYPIIFPALGKNLLDNESFQIVDGYYKWTGTIGGSVSTSSYSKINKVIDISLYAGSTMTLNKRPGGTNPSILFVNDKDLIIGGIKNDGAEANTPWTFQVPVDAKYILISVPHNATDIQLELGSTSTEYEPFNNTVYGGYVDLVTGELVQTHAIKRVVGNEDWYMASGINGVCAYRPTLLNVTSALDGGNYMLPVCNKLSGVAKWGTTINECTINNYGNFYFGAPEELSTSEAVNNWIQSIGGFEFTYPISPVTHQLTPTQLSTLIGRNNIWSNADRVEVEYDLAESNDELYRRRNILLRSAPHIETASGNIAHFETDLVAPIKSAIVSFSPVQTGSGDPSPTNVRSISGWSGVTTGQSTKNLIMYPLHSFAYESGTTISPLDEYTTFITIDNGIKIKPRNSATGAYCLLGYVFSNKTYTLSWNTNFDSTYSRYRVEIRSNKEFTKPTSEYEHLFSSNWQYSFENNPYTFTANTDGWLWINFHQNTTASEFTISNIQLEEGNTKTSFEQSNIFLTNWQTAAGTIYGGYVDLATGEVYETYGIVKVANRTWNNYSGKLRYYIALQDRKPYGLVYSDTLTPDDSGQFTRSNVGELCYYGNISTLYYQNFFITLPEVMEVADANAWIKETYPNAMFIYELATPRLVTTITHSYLYSLRGTNNIWTDSNGPVEIKYWRH